MKDYFGKSGSWTPCRRLLGTIARAGKRYASFVCRKAKKPSHLGHWRGLKIWSRTSLIFMMPMFHKAFAPPAECLSSSKKSLNWPMLPNSSCSIFRPSLFRGLRDHRLSPATAPSAKLHGLVLKTQKLWSTLFTWSLRGEEGHITKAARMLGGMRKSSKLEDRL